jgi:ankyrin repeat protein
VRPNGVSTIRSSTQLIRAALLNNLPRVLQLVQLGAPLDDTDRDGVPFTALHWACELGHERVAEALLDGKYEGRGANINLLSAGRTPLMLASSFGHEVVARLLLARGARQEPQDSRGLPALHWAVLNDHPSNVELLWAAPGAAAALALRDSGGRTPLAITVARGHAACAAVLREHGATA